MPFPSLNSFAAELLVGLDGLVVRSYTSCENLSLRSTQEGGGEVLPAHESLPPSP